MNQRPSTVLILGASGGMGRLAVAQAVQQGYAGRALVRYDLAAITAGSLNARR